MRAIKAILRIFSLFSIVIASMTIFFFVNRDDHLEIDNFYISSSKIPIGVTKKIVQISDWHNHSLEYPDGKNILDEIDTVNPDYIFVTGDIVDDHTTQKDFDRLDEMYGHFFKKGYPVYYADGNHEAATKIETLMPKTHQILSDNGVHILENIDKDNKVFQGISADLGNNIKVVGLADQGYTEDKGFHFERQFGNVEEQLKNLDQEVTDSSFNIMLSHRPENFDLISKHSYDLTFSGHLHGGQVRLADWRMLVFSIPAPKYYDGKYDVDGKSIIVSRGLGTSYHAPFRYNCKPDLVCLTLTSSKLMR